MSAPRKLHEIHLDLICLRDTIALVAEGLDYEKDTHEAHVYNALQLSLGALERLTEEIEPHVSAARNAPEVRNATE